MVSGIAENTLQHGQGRLLARLTGRSDHLEVRPCGIGPAINPRDGEKIVLAAVPTTTISPGAVHITLLPPPSEGGFIVCTSHTMNATTGAIRGSPRSATGTSRSHARCLLTSSAARSTRNRSVRCASIVHYRKGVEQQRHPSRQAKCRCGRSRNQPRRRGLSASLRHHGVRLRTSVTDDPRRHRSRRGRSPRHHPAPTPARREGMWRRW